MITSPEERALYGQWSKLWDEYKKGTEEVMALSRKEAGKLPREAQELNAKTVNKIGLQADEVLNKDIELNTKGGDQAAPGCRRQLRLCLHAGFDHSRRRRHDRHRCRLLSGP